MPKWNKCKVSAIFKTGASFVQSLKGTGLHFFIFRNVENLCFDGRQKVKKMGLTISTCLKSNLKALDWDKNSIFKEWM